MANGTGFNVLMAGTGEYTTGYTGSGASKSDKRMGVVMLVLADMRRRSKLNKLFMVGTTGLKNPQIREHLRKNLGSYTNMDVSVEFTVGDDVKKDYEAYKPAIDRMEPGDGVTVFTPDDTHFDIALYAIRRGLHVLIAKPATKTLQEQKILIEEAKKRGVLVMIEYHKRFDQIYADARERIRTFGDFSYYSSYMSQPKAQLETFKSWLSAPNPGAGRSSDISYYLNSHHIDMHTWAMQGIAVPLTVTAHASTGVAVGEPYNCAEGTEDTIVLLVKWKNIKSGSIGTAVYTASWIAPKSDVHSQQRFHYMGHTGEIRVDQAHRGYEVTTDQDGFANPNPLFLRYTPDARGFYAGQQTYGHRSIEQWADACAQIKAGEATAADFIGVLPTVEDTAIVTAILEAGRKSIDAGGKPMDIESWVVGA